MTEHAPDRFWSGIDIPKTIAGVLAALSAAVIGSFLGVAGTLAGAAIASLIGSVGTEVYHRLFDRGRKTLQSTFTTAPAAVGTPPVATEASPPSALPSPTKKIRWGRVAMVASALFVLAMGTLTLAEVFSGRSVADATRGGSGDRLTVSSIFNDRSDKSPSTDTSELPSSDDGTDEGDRSGDSGGGDGTGTAPATTAPADQPTEAPATEQPADGGATAPADGASGADAGAPAADTQNSDSGTE